MNKTNLQKLGFPILFFLLGTLAAAYLHWPALTNPTTYKSDVRQCPHWAAYHTTSFQDDDLLVQYGQFNESPIQNLLYYVGTFFVDMVFLTKLVAVIGYGLSALVFFLVGQALFGTRGGVLTGFFFTCCPDQFIYFAGGFSKMWIIPLLVVLVYILQQESWRYLIILMPFAALAYPMTPVLMGITILVYVFLCLPTDPQKAGSVFYNLALGSAFALALLLMKYLFPSSEIGTMTPHARLLQMPEMYRGGLCKYLPVPALHTELLSHVMHPFTLGSAILFLLILRKNIVWTRVWTALLLASIIGYVAADSLFMRLYIPNRYARYSLPVLLILWNARNWDLVLRKIPWKRGQYAMLVVLLLVAGFLYKDTFTQGKDTINRVHLAPLSQFLRTLPENILIAGHPRIMDDIPIQAKRSVLCNYKMAHPWFATYYDEIQERTYATFRAMYASDPKPLNELHQRYGVTHFVVGKKYMERVYTRKRIYVNPYEGYIRFLLQGKTTFFLNSPPREAVIYEDARYIVLTLPIEGEASEI